MPLKKLVLQVLADFSRSVWTSSGGKKHQKTSPRFYPGVSPAAVTLGGHHIYYEPPDEFEWSADAALLPPGKAGAGEVIVHRREVLHPLSDAIDPPEDGQEAGKGRAYTEEEFTSAILARKQGGSSPPRLPLQEVDPSRLSGKENAKTATEAVDPLLPMGENGEVSRPSGGKDGSATDFEGEKQCLKTPAPRLDTSVSPVPERRNKGVLGRLKSFASRTSYSTSEDGHSHSSDYEELDEEKKMEMRFQREAKERNSASWVRHLRRDVKRRISRLRNNRSVCATSEEVKESNENTEGPLHTGSSVESIPSGSGSSLQPPTPTSSNRSSTSAGEDENAPYVGAFLGRARALVDCTPSPYDRDGLAFKKGDVIDIIAKHKTGIWVGMVQGRVGHFKFINVEEISLDEWKPRPKKHKVPAQWLTTGAKPETLEQLLKQLGLLEYMNVFVLNGYDELNTFKEIEREDLDSLGIVSPEHAAKLLRAAEMLQGIDVEDDVQLMQSPRDSGCYASNENLAQQESTRHNSTSRPVDGEDVDTSHSESGIHSREGPDLSLPMNNLDLSTESSTKSTLTTLDSREEVPVPDPSEGSDELSNFNIPPSQADADAGIHESFEVSSPPAMEQKLFDSKDSEPFVPVTTFANSISSSVVHENGVSTNCSSLPTVSETCVSMPNIREMSPVSFTKESRSKGSRSKHNCRKTKDKDFGKQFSHYQQTLAKHRELEFPFGPNPYSHGFASFPKKDKKHSRRRVQEYDDIVSDPALDPEESPSRNIYKRTKQRKGSLQELVRNPRPPSVSLLSLVKQKLEQENINLFEEPYSDKTGFCGIPPALVQRYAEELHQSLTDVAVALDQIRITSLQQQARRGVPNDFLADSCTVPVIEANYSCLHDWLVSLGLPMYEANLASAGYRHLEQIIELNAMDLTYFGIQDQRHQLLLESAIYALKTRFGGCSAMPAPSYPMV